MGGFQVNDQIAVKQDENYLQTLPKTFKSFILTFGT